MKEKTLSFPEFEWFNTKFFDDMLDVVFSLHFNKGNGTFNVIFRWTYNTPDFYFWASRSHIAFEK